MDCEVLHMYIHVCTDSTGCQYGRIPWNDADVTVLVDEKGTAKFCLQELCTKVGNSHNWSYTCTN